MSQYLAQLNVGVFRYPVDDPRMAGFMDNLDLVNAIALSGGLVYIGGTFTNVGGQPRQNIAAVDAR